MLLHRSRTWLLCAHVILLTLGWVKPLGALPTSGDTVRFVVIGDYGDDRNKHEAAVATLVKSLDPELIITTGDNNYPRGEETTIDRNIGRDYAAYIYPYKGQYGPGAVENRFFPSLGDHDWRDGEALRRGRATNERSAKAYLDWFELPGNERYYEFARGPVRFFALDSDPREPDGAGKDSKQAMWLRDRLREAKEPWKVVYFHHAPYTSGKRHGPSLWMRWPFGQWGASVVFAGHEHSYERLLVTEAPGISEIPFFVDGVGGAELSGFAKGGVFAPGSERRLSAYGALLVIATRSEMTFEFHKVRDPQGEPSDRYTVYSHSVR